MEHVYFTWPDRRFRYDCRGCGACCKGHGIGIDVAGGQLVQLVSRRPALAAFLRRRGEAITAFNPRDRCWFLSDDGLCRIELDDGRAAKPASCRLFPFNRVFRLGPYTIVDYNSVICPLHIADADADDGVRHADIAAEIASITDAAIIANPLPARDPAAEGQRFITTERAIAAAIFAAPGDVAAAWSAQADATSSAARSNTTQAAVAAETAERTPAGGAAAGAAGEADAQVARDASAGATHAAGISPAGLDDARTIASDAFTALLDTSWQVPSLPTLTAASWLTPSLRFNELYGPRQYAPRAIMGPVLARMWLAWLGFAALGEQLAGRPLGLQELTTLWSEQAPVMHAVARWTEVPILKPGAIELPGTDPGNLVRALAQSFIDNRKARRPLGELVARTLPADPASRITTLKTADGILRSSLAKHG